MKRLGAAFGEVGGSEEGEGEGEETMDGRMMDPAKEMREKRTRAREPRRAMSPTTSVEDWSESAVVADWR